MQRKNSPKSSHRTTPPLTLLHRGEGKGWGKYPVYYPAFLNIQGKKVAVIGGGKVAERKILSLLRAGANVTVISPEVTKKIAREKLRDRIRHVPRQYRRSDVKDAFLVIAATDSHDINKKVSEDSPCLVNVVDIPSLCNFIVPSVVKRGSLTIAISTSGISPALSRSIRKELKKLYGSAFGKYLQLLEKMRKKTKEGIRDKKQRTEFLKGLAREETIRMLRQKGYKEVVKRIAKSIERRTEIQELKELK